MQDKTIDLELLVSQEFAENPYPTLKYLRDHHPVYNLPGTDVWLLTRYDDVVNAFRDAERFSSENRGEDIGIILGGKTIIELNGTEHIRKRNLVAAVFVGKSLKSMLPVIQRHIMTAVESATTKRAGEIAEELSGVGHVDIIEVLASQLPVNVIMEVLDLPSEGQRLLREWYPIMIEGMVVPSKRELGIQTNEKFHEYLDPLIEEKLANPGDDLMSKLAHAEVDGLRMTNQEIKAFITLVFVAGADTTNIAISNIWYWLLSNPEQLAAVQEDPSLLDQAFAETLRIHGSSPFQRRLATEDIELHGTVIPAGATVMMSQWAANRDDRVFKDPDKFDLFRDDLDPKIGGRSEGKASHIGFGSGAHLCIGRHLAHTETVISTREMLKVMKNPRFKPGSNPKPRSSTADSSKLEVEFDLSAD